MRWLFIIWLSRSLMRFIKSLIRGIRSWGMLRWIIIRFIGGREILGRRIRISLGGGLVMICEVVEDSKFVIYYIIIACTRCYYYSKIKNLWLLLICFFSFVEILWNHDHQIWKSLIIHFQNLSKPFPKQVYLIYFR